MVLPPIDPAETEAAFTARLLKLGVSKSSAKKHAAKQQVLRCLNDGTTLSELVKLVRRIVHSL